MQVQIDHMSKFSKAEWMVGNSLKMESFPNAPCRCNHLFPFRPPQGLYSLPLSMFQVAGKQALGKAVANRAIKREYREPNKRDFL